MKRFLKVVMAVIVLASLPVAHAEELGTWQKDQKKSEMTEETTFYWLTISTNKVVNSIGQPHHVGLSTACSPSGLAIALMLDSYLGNEMIQVRYKLDRGEIILNAFDVTKSGDSAILYNSEAMSFLQKMAGHKKLVFEVSPYNSGPVEVVFDISGIDAVLADVEKTCPAK